MKRVSGHLMCFLGIVSRAQAAFRWWPNPSAQLCPDLNFNDDWGFVITNAAGDHWDVTRDQELVLKHSKTKGTKPIWHIVPMNSENSESHSVRINYGPAWPKKASIGFSSKTNVMLDRGTADEFILSYCMPVETDWDEPVYEVRFYSLARSQYIGVQARSEEQSSLVYLGYPNTRWYLNVIPKATIKLHQMGSRDAGDYSDID